MRWCIRAAVLSSVMAVMPGLALAWSCSSEEPLAAVATPEQRARAALEVARARALAEAVKCQEAGQSDCPQGPAPVPVASKPAGTIDQ